MVSPTKFRKWLTLAADVYDYITRINNVMTKVLNEIKHTNNLYIQVLKFLLYKFGIPLHAVQIKCCKKNTFTT